MYLGSQKGYEMPFVEENVPFVKRLSWRWLGYPRNDLLVCENKDKIAFLFAIS